MKRSFLLLPSSMFVLLACGGSTPPPEPPQPAPPTAAVMPTSAVAETPKPAEPTPEEKKKMEAKAALEKDRAKMKSDLEAEKARWTPEIKAEATKLADKAYPSGKDAIKAAMASKVRKPGDADRDKYRHPAEMMDFFGFKPTMTVLEYAPGEGWFTELLAPSLAKKGKLFATNSDPNGPEDERSTFYGQRFKSFLETSPEMYGKVETVLVDGKAPNFQHDGAFDMVLMFRELHGMVNSNKIDDYLAAANASLKPNGILAIEEHRAMPDANPQESAKKGYLPEKWVIEKVEAAGFKLAAKSEMNANKKDTKDYADGVWTLPPTLRNGDKDKDKYMAIGESDRMTLKFTKVAKKADAAAKPAAAKPGTDTPGAKPAMTKPATATPATKPATKTQ